MKHKQLYIIAIVSMALIISLLVNIATVTGINTAHNAGKRAMYLELRPAIKNAMEALENIRPLKGIATIPGQANSQAEHHPDIIKSVGLEDFVYNNCTDPVIDNYHAIADYSIEQGIHPALPFAIAWADTNCGRHLSTPNNFGNVGNTDGGQRIGYFTPLEGFKAIVDALNNRNMGRNTNIGQLSQGGRYKIMATYDCAHAPAPFKCYATSPENWHNNVTRALATIFGLEAVAHDWGFRL